MKQRLLRFSNIAGIIWIVCMMVVIGIIAVASRFMTHDPDFSPGQSENAFLLPMLITFFVGAISFGAMLLTGIASFFAKGEKQFKVLIPFKYLFILVAFIVFGLAAFLFAFRQQNLSNYNTANYNGDDTFNAINKYRQENGLKTLTIDPILCDNLVQRYLDIKNPDNKYVGHAGFERWIKQESITGYSLAEVYVTDTQIPEDAIKFWAGSPGHKGAVLGDYEVGCAYANEGIAVAVFGKKTQ